LKHCNLHRLRPAAEALYNGIVLPEVWPQFRDIETLRRGEWMEVPYLKTPPAVIPIDLVRQLFVDDFLIDPKAELAEARRLIEKHGYWRRKEELEDAEAAAIHW
jgi:hypothetical protein